MSELSLRLHDHGTPDKEFLELEGYLSCKAREDAIVRARMANADKPKQAKQSENDSRRVKTHVEGRVFTLSRPCLGF